MCGRFLMNEDVVASLETLVPSLWEEIPLDVRFGVIYPSNEAIVVSGKKDQLVASMMPFGFFSQSMNRRIINARSETAAHKGMFARAWRTSRCAVPASAFYEWTPSKEKITFDEPGQTMYLASLAIEDQFVILTKPANHSVSPYHHRMPVILDQGQVRDWILDESEARALVLSASPSLEAFSDQPTLF